MRRRLKASEVNHLRRLLGWVRGSDGVFQTPEQIVETFNRLGLDQISDAGKQRLLESHQKAASIPKYVRAALKALEPLTKEDAGEVIEQVTRKKPRLVQWLSTLEDK